MMRKKMIDAIKEHARGHIEKHKMNIENLIMNNVGVAEHPDYMDTVSKEVETLAKWDEQLQMLDKHFS